jgi:hypothetical protein
MHSPKVSQTSVAPLRAVPETVAGTAVRPRPYASVWKVWLPVVAMLVLLDATFNLYFWRIPKLSKTNADYGYQFLVDSLPLWGNDAPGRTRVLALGSSIALSFDPTQVQSLLEAALPQASFDVHRLLLPGVHPSDYVMYFEEHRMEKAPDAVVLLVNLVDFLYADSERDVNPTLRYILSPWTLLAERRDNMSVTSQLDAIASGTSRLYRYRKLVRSSLHDHARALMHWRRSEPSSAYGVYPDGYTKQSFALPLDGEQSATLRYFVDPEWIRQRGEVKLEASVGDEVLLTRHETEAGWKTATFGVPGRSGGLLRVRADSAWVPRADGQSDDTRLLGVRLDSAPVNARVDSFEPFRYGSPRKDELDPFLRMGGKTGDEFARAWDETLRAQTRFGRRFRVYRDAKLALRDQPFHATREYEAIRRLADMFRERGAQVLIINTPESPWILNEYRDGPYYRGYLEFFGGLASASSNVRFHDWSEGLPPEDFNDWHHPNYIGSIKLGQRYAAAVAEALRPRAH